MAGVTKPIGPVPLAELQTAATRLIESSTFSRAPRLRHFLSFVVRCAVEGRSHEVNEYSIGVEVFSRDPNYNPNLDNIVRVTARQLRSKLTEYYSGEGRQDPWKLEIPKGSYQVTILPNLPQEPQREAPPRPARRRLSGALIAVSILGLAGWAVAAWLWLGPDGKSPQPAHLLTSLLTDRAHVTTIVLDDPVFGRAWWKIGHQLGLNGLVTGRYLDPGYYTTDQDRFLLRMIQQQNFVPFSSMLTMRKLSAIARSHGVEPEVASSRSLKPQQMERGNFVFVGGITTNPWVGEIQKHLAFEHAFDGPPDNRRYFINRSPRPGEQAVFETTDSNPDEKYFTRVAVLGNPFGPGRIALLGGTSRDATEAAGQFALSQNGADQITRLCGAPIGQLAGFEVILGTKSVAGAPLTYHILASRCTKR